MAGLTSSNRNQFPLSTVELCWPVLGTSLTVGWQLLETKFGDCCDKLGWASTDRHATSLLMSLPPRWSQSESVRADLSGVMRCARLVWPETGWRNFVVKLVAVCVYYVTPY